MENRFIIDQKALCNILASMQPICSKRTALDATSSVLFAVGPKEVIIKSTDLEISLQATCSLIESDALHEESFLVSGRRIFEVVKELEGPITCILTRNQLRLEAGDVHLALHIKESEEFPPFPERIENLLQLDAALLRTMLDSVAFLIPQSNANPAMNGLLLELSKDSLTMTTTDGHCLAQVSTEKTHFHEAKTWLLPRRAIFELKKILETSEDTILFLGICGNQLVFSGELFNFFTRLLADQFPNYRTILDKTAFEKATIERSRFVKTLKRSVCLLSNQFVATKFVFSDTTLHVSMKNKDVGSLDETVTFIGSKKTAMDIRFYAPYLLNGIQSLHDDTLTFYLKSSTKPIIFESQAEGFSVTYLVMPVSPSMG